MEARDDGDPFFWDVARVVKELCTSDRTWTAPSAAKLPDPDHLSEKLIELEIDGEALLTYGETLGSLKDLLVGELGLKKVPHRMSIQKAIKEFQARSTEYQRWKKENSAVESDEDVDRDTNLKREARDGNVLANGREATTPVSNNDQQGLSLPPAEDQSSLTNHRAIGNTASMTPAREASLPPATGRDGLSPGDHPEQPPKKKQRIAPTVLSTAPSGKASFITTDADTVRTWPGATAGPSWADNGPESSYLGSRGFTFSPARDREELSDEDTCFSLVKTGSECPGRRLQVNKAMKGYLLRRTASGVDASGDSDVLIPLFGESDDETDEEGWREYQEEEAEREQLEALKRTFLSKEQVDQVIQEAIKAYEDAWNEKKKPKELLKASKLWNDARRLRSRQHLISEAAHICRALDTRINKLIKSLGEEQWANVEELKKQMDNCEISIGQRQAQRFRLQVLSNPTEPPKPRKVPRPIVYKKQPVRRMDDSDVLTDSDDGLDQFIIDDEVVQSDAEEHDPFDLENAPVDLLFQTEQQGSLELSRDNAAGPDAGHPNFGEDRELSYSPPPAGDPMDLDQDGGSDTDGDYSPPPVPESDTVTHLDVVSTAPAVQPVDDDLVQAGVSTTPVKSTAGRISPPVDEPSSKAHEADAALDTPDISKRPNAEEMTAVASLGVAFWLDGERDRAGLLVALLWKWPADLRDALSAAVRGTGKNEAESLWDSHVDPMKTQAQTNGAVQALDIDGRVSLGLVQLYISWLARNDFGHAPRESLAREDFALLETHHKPQQFRKFLRRLRHLLRGFRAMAAAGTEGDTSGQDGTVAHDSQHEVPPPTEAEPEQQDRDEAEEEDASQQEDDDEEGPISPTNKSRKARQRRRIIHNTAAADMRETNFEQKALFESRKRRLREGLEAVPKDMARFIINETKEDDEELVYVNERTRPVIKDHQVEGVRFMWNQIVAKSKVRQGCLLAHTMGLGKTMQVVTLLVAIAEAALSKDKAVYKQIPKQLRESRTLILCPPGLVNNWIDELNIWTPEHDADGQPLADNEVGFLGCVFKIDAALPKHQRPGCVAAWQASGGVLVVGYAMFLQLSKDPEMLEILRDTPNMVVADEAHKLKNSSALIHQVTQNFRTASRIAMTGSPLTNNVTDYYHMVSWVAPNYLGPYPEFKAVYEDPVSQGLHADSHPGERRQAVKTLNILRETVSPLVHRMGILALKDDLPQKKEFILYLKLTKLQMAAYSAYLRRIVYDSAVRDRLGKGMTSIWTFVNDLAVLLAHPSIYKKRLQQQKAKQKALRDADSGEGTPAGRSPDEEDSETATLDISPDVKSELLATLSTRDLENVAHSWKVVVLRTILDECRRIGDKVLVFSQHLPTLNFLEEMFRRDKRNFYRLDGKTPPNERQAAVKHFNDDPKAEVYLISTRAGGEGLNIHGANRVVIFDFKYVPMEEQQAVGRAYRIGQTKPVFVYWLTVADTFEESVHNRSVFKLQLASRVVDKKNPLSWSKRAANLFPKDGKMPSIPPRDPDIPHYAGRDVVLDALLDSEPLSESIRKIIMTETFEEEEPDDKILTTDDRQEILKQVAENRQRGTSGWTGPSHAAAVLQPKPSLVPPPIPGLSWARLAQAGRESPPPTQATQQLTAPRVIKVQVPEHLRTNRPSGAPLQGTPPAAGALDSAQWTVPSTGLAGSGAVAIPAAAAFARADGRHPSSPSHVERTDQPVTALPASASTATPGHAPAALPHGPRVLGNPAPIAGAGTMFAPQGVQPPSGQQSGREDDNVEKALAGKKRRFGEMLWAHFHSLKGDLGHAAAAPTDLVGAFDRALEKNPHNSEAILLVDFWSSLIKTLEKSDRFLTAILFGLANAETVSNMRREEISALVKGYDSMDESTFRKLVLNVDVGKSHGRAEGVVVHTEHSVERLENPKHRASLTTATQQPEVENRLAARPPPIDMNRRVPSHKKSKKKQRLAHLPDWAHRAVANEGGDGSSKSPRGSTPAASQRYLKDVTPHRQSSQQQPFRPRPGQSHPSQQPRRSASGPTVPQAGDSPANALVIE